MEEIMKKLKAPFPASKVKWRVGKTSKDKKRGLALAYIDSREVMNRLDDVVGPANWQRIHDFGNNGEVMCGLQVRLDGEWITKWDGASQTNFEAQKGGLSDSFKRAAVNFGIGRYLYDLPAKWVDLDKYKNIKKPPKLPSWALPDGDEQKKEDKSKAKEGKINYALTIRQIANGNKQIQNTVKQELDRKKGKTLDDLEQKDLEYIYNLVS